MLGVGGGTGHMGSGNDTPMSVPNRDEKETFETNGNKCVHWASYMISGISSLHE